MPRLQGPSPAPEQATPAIGSFTSNAYKGHIRLADLENDGVVLRIMQAIHAQTKPAQIYSNASQASASFRMGFAYVQSACSADLNVRPLLLYYALLNWLKGLLYILDVNYPENTSVLQHGLSVRRTKRSSYRWAYDFVQVHREGVFPSFHNLIKISTGNIHNEEFTGKLENRYIVGELAGYLPVLRQTLVWTYPQFIHTFPVQPLDVVPTEFNRVDSSRDDAFGVTSKMLNIGLVPREIASNQNQTPEHWKQAYHRQFVSKEGTTTEWVGSDTMIGTSEETSDQTFEQDSGQTFEQTSEPEGFLKVRFPSGNHPWVVQTQPEVWISDTDPPPPWMIHCILLFSLSALCRYNPAEWMDIVLWNNEKDAHLIRTYLDHLAQPNVLEAAVANAFQRHLSTMALPFAMTTPL